MNKLRKDDEVIVIAGKDKGKRGKIIRQQGERVLVENVNLVSKHTKPNPQANQPGGIIKQEAMMHVSNVAIFNAASDKADRVGIKTLEDGKKVRIFKSNQEQIDI